MQNQKKNKKLYASIKKDGINPKDYMKYETRFSCDECSHFDHVAEKCSLGYNSQPHRKANQIKQYELSGNMALCRFHEID